MCYSIIGKMRQPFIDSCLLFRGLIVYCNSDYWKTFRQNIPYESTSFIVIL